MLANGKIQPSSQRRSRFSRINIKSNPSPRHTVGVILAGGKGQRLHGQDKGLLPLNGRRLVDTLIEIIKPQVDTIIISANRNLDTYAGYQYPVVPDKDYDGCGPLAGIWNVMQSLDNPAAKNEIEKQKIDLLVTPCDLPNLPNNLFARLQAAGPHIPHNNPVIASDGKRIHPLLCLLPLALKSQLGAYLNSGGRKVADWMQAQECYIADMSDVANTFVNINTPKDLHHYLEQGNSSKKHAVPEDVDFSSTIHTNG
ncbi:molybdenum cofactor guanylyltransferase MobA [Kaarinaea lacus]